MRMNLKSPNGVVMAVFGLDGYLVISLDEVYMRENCGTTNVSCEILNMWYGYLSGTVTRLSAL